MKKIKLMAASALILGALTFTSCKKDYTCTCTTVVAGVSSTNTHDIKNATHTDANRTCKNYEDNTPGSTTCHL